MFILDGIDITAKYSNRDHWLIYYHELWRLKTDASLQATLWHRTIKSSALTGRC